MEIALKIAFVMLAIAALGASIIWFVENRCPEVDDEGNVIKAEQADE